MKKILAPKLRARLRPLLPCAMAKTTPGLDPGLQVWRVVPVGERLDWASWRDFGADALVVDTPSGGRGGSGTTFDSRG